MTRSFIFFIVLLFSFNIFVLEQSYGSSEDDVSETPKLLYKNQDWSLYLYKENGSLACLVHSDPIFTDGNYKKKGPSSIYFNHVAPNIDELSITSGYPYSDKSVVSIAFYYSDGESVQNIIKNVLKNAKDGNCHTGSSLNIILDVIVDEAAWARDIEVDNNAVKSAKKGYYLIATGKSTKGTCSVDVYSLKGFSSVYKKMLQECE